MKRLRPLALLLLGASVIFAVGYLAGACFIAAWDWTLAERLLAAAVALAAGLALVMVAVLLSVEVTIGYRRAQKDARDEATPLRWVIFCGVCREQITGKPYAFDEKRGFTCMECLKQERASAN